MTVPVKILIVDDQQLLRLGFRMIFEAQPDLDVVGEAGDGTEAVRLTGQTHPDVVLMGHPDAPHHRHRGHRADRRQVPGHPGAGAHHFRP